MIYMIAAQAKNRAIGNKGKIPWVLKADTQYYHARANDQVLIMGRNTFQGWRGRHIAGSKIIVVSKDSLELPEPYLYADSIEKALELALPEDAYVIGGGQIFAAALPYANAIYLTEIDHEYEGDTFFPELDPAQWRKTRSVPGNDPDFPYRFFFNYYERIK